jgi:hypothetical protein
VYSVHSKYGTVHQTGISIPMGEKWNLEKINYSNPACIIKKHNEI